MRDPFTGLDPWPSERPSYIIERDGYLCDSMGRRILRTALPRKEAKRHPSSQAFHDKLVVVGQMHDKKQLDYGSDKDPFANVRGSEDLGIPGWCGAVLRNNDKQHRLARAVKDTLTTGAPQLANEGVQDGFVDQAVYALIGSVLYDEWERDRGQA